MFERLVLDDLWNAVVCFQPPRLLIGYGLGFCSIHCKVHWRVCRRLGSCHRVDSVIESSLQEIIGSKNFALINLSLNFCETTIYDKVFLENLVAVH